MLLNIILTVKEYLKEKYIKSVQKESFQLLIPFRQAYVLDADVFVLFKMFVIRGFLKYGLFCFYLVCFVDFLTFSFHYM